MYKHEAYRVQFQAVTSMVGAHGSVVVKALCSKAEGRGFETPVR
jgi:hypothetical protein